VPLLPGVLRPAVDSSYSDAGYNEQRERAPGQDTGDPVLNRARPQVGIDPPAARGGYEGPPSGDPVLRAPLRHAPDFHGIIAHDYESPDKPPREFVEMGGRNYPILKAADPGQQPILRSGVPSSVTTPELTPQEKNLVQHHLNNLYGPGKVISPEGNVSSVLQAVVDGPGGRYYNIPTVWDGKALTVDEASERAAKVGWDKWPSYATPEQADLRYEWMHESLAKDTERYVRAGGAPGPLELNLKPRKRR
jgi:hypothetical protein